MKRKRYKISLTDFEAKEILGKVNATQVYQFEHESERNAVKQKRDSFRENLKYNKYCDENGINKEDVSVYWDKSKDFSIMVRPNVENEFDVFAKVKELIESYTPKKIEVKPIIKSDVIAQLIFTDAHIGMDASDKGQSLYGGSWTEKNIKQRLKIMVNSFLNNTPKEIDCIQVLNLGDFADGLDGYTTSRTHKLPQNMSNEQVFDLGVYFMTYIADALLQHKKCNKIIFYNVCNSNHSASFDYFIFQAFKGRFLNVSNVEVINETKFVGHIKNGVHTEVITHGKDSKNMKFGLNPYLIPKTADFFKEYINHHELNGHISIHKGDSHRYNNDLDQEFDFTSYLAFSPSSGWVQNNFKRGRSGFSIKLKNKKTYSGTNEISNEFKWNSDELK